MVYTESTDADYGTLVTTYASLDGWLTTVYNQVKQSTYYTELYDDNLAHYNYQLYDETNDVTYIEDKNTKYNFYSSYNSHYRKYYSNLQPNRDKETLNAIIYGTVPLGLIVLLIMLCYCGCIKCKKKTIMEV